MPSEKVLSGPKGFNPALERMEYAVRGMLVLRAEELSRQLSDPLQADKLPFNKIVYCNIGNPQSVGQPPLTFPRQVLAAIMHPPLLQSANLPSDVVQRANLILSHSHGLGAYTESRGLQLIRERVADAISIRDDVPSDPDHIFLTNGASDAVKTLLSMLVRGADDGVMIPIPQYPLYSASMTALGGYQVSYYLNEDAGWALSTEELETRLAAAKADGIKVRALVVINPGNPTGQVLSRSNLEAVVRFCEKHRLVLFADEVYQKNVYVDDKPFISFKRIVSDLGSDVELASFHSVSKGMVGECGLRGGLVELTNIDAVANQLMYKALSVSLCSNVVGQTAVDLMMTPPAIGEPSYDLYNREFNNIYGSLRRKSIKLANAFNTFEGVSCNRSEGAMYLFPRISIPDKAIAESQKRGFACADVLYCLELLESTGICVVPGSGFGQQEGTYHFRTTFLPPEDTIDGVIKLMRRFHENFLTKYS